MRTEQQARKEAEAERNRQAMLYASMETEAAKKRGAFFPPDATPMYFGTIARTRMGQKDAREAYAMARRAAHLARKTFHYTRGECPALRGESK